jgi:hypothetical protein
MSRPFQVTTNAAVKLSAGWNAASTAASSFAGLMSAGSGSFGNMSPMGQG